MLRTKEPYEEVKKDGTRIVDALRICSGDDELESSRAATTTELP